MSAEPESAEGTSLRAFEAAKLLSSFTDFLTIALHSLLYHRGLYPTATFLTARAYNLPVHQSRYPKLCNWINDAVAAVSAQLQSRCVRHIALVIHAPSSLDVLERWIFDVSSFPDWGPPLPLVGEDADDLEGDDDVAAAIAEAEEALNWTDINEALRGALARIAYAAESLPNTPPGSTFTLAVELHDEAPAPIGHPQPWIPSQPDLQTPAPSKSTRGPARQAASTTPVRAVRAGPLFFECWIEHAAAKSTPENAKG
ncbi:hypothetical protein S7711_00493 [Stachybotrys chartarum IBT 7711]|uniref:HORMA domain-containing protein n=1 Tax=Stachybotrys chartarum (strain CBS 109288 / IBT 7711) TaxID=1280523 RepID=A0A084B9V7_STACB|nr:hypothetical protein S7711_00493 [Stachybotrys chartarum IBT 7711]KFA53445.1 hypothetical protein S40293_03418 [Stachybotrys chartarum IBT 40293]